MENASKALLMSAGTLIAILILALMNRLFGSASQVTKSYDDSMQVASITQFNTNFTKYLDAGVGYNGLTNQVTRQNANIYDVISLANFAKNYNNNFSQETNDNNDPAIVKVDLKNIGETAPIITNLQNYSKSAQDYLISNCYYANNASPNAKYVITFKIKIESSNDTGRINHVSFIPDKDISIFLQNAESLRNN